VPSGQPNKEKRSLPIDHAGIEQPGKRARSAALIREEHDTSDPSSARRARVEAKEIVASITRGGPSLPPVPDYNPGPPPDRSSDRIERVARPTVVVSDSESEGGEEESPPDPFIAYADSSADTARKRNLQRIQKANADDKLLLGKYLPSDASVFFPCRLVGPDDDVPIPDSWVDEVRNVTTSEPPKVRGPSVRFSLAEEDLDNNEEVLRRNDHDFQKVMEELKGTTAYYGSEFRDPNVLEPILGKHPAFGYLSDLFRTGMPYHFTAELTEEERKGEMEEQIQRGNHKSASTDPDKVSALLAKDVKHGFSMPVRVEALKELKGAMVQPCGLATQFGLMPDGSRKLKKRLTHDLSYSLTMPETSVNSRVDMARYPEMVYGWCLSRVIHFVVALRVKYPDTKILIAKFDYSDAYRRVSHASSSIAQTIIVWAGIAYIALRLAFGGSPNPACFCAFSETLTDLSNDISRSNYSPATFQSPTTSPEHLAEKVAHPDGVPFKKGEETAVEIPLSETRRKDCFIDDIIAVFLATTENLLRECHTVPVAVHVMSRPHMGEEHEPVPRRPLLAPDKLEAEGRPSERQVVLGWMVDTRELRVSLPTDKFRAWMEDLEGIIRSRTSTLKELESLVGRLNHASFLIPLGRHFLNGLRARIPSDSGRRSRTWSSKLVKFNQDDLEDLRLWERLLTKANEGISMNLLTIRNPTHIAWSDSCPFGLGGYTLRGTAWRVRIDDRWSFRGDDSVNNLLEFLGMTVSILLMIRETQPDEEAVLLALGDNTSAIGWIFKSGRLPKQSRYYAPARKMARKIAEASIQANVQVVAQHLKGVFNDVADLLSFEGDDRGKQNPLTRDRPDDETLTHRLHSSYTQIIPENFEISDLPPEIDSFISATLGTIEESWTRNKKSRGASQNERGRHGIASYPHSESRTHSSTGSQANPENSSPEDSSANYETVSQTSRTRLLHNVRNQWWRRLCALPSATWLRRSGQTTGRVPCTSATGEEIPTNSSHPKSRTSSGPWNKWTRLPTGRRP